MEMTLMMLAASSASGSGQYLFARTRQASASWTWLKNYNCFWDWFILGKGSFIIFNSRLKFVLKNAFFVKEILNSQFNSQCLNFFSTRRRACCNKLRLQFRILDIKWLLPLFLCHLEIIMLDDVLWSTCLDSLQVYSIHDGSLEESYCGEVSLDQTLQL